MENIKEFIDCMESLGFKTVVVDEKTDISVELSGALGDGAEESEESEKSEESGKENNMEKSGKSGKSEKSEEFDGIESFEEMEKYMTRKHPISRREFNYACDAVVESWADELTFSDIFTLARFTSAVRNLLF